MHTWTQIFISVIHILCIEYLTLHFISISLKLIESLPIRCFWFIVHFNSYAFNPISKQRSTFSLAWKKENKKFQTTMSINWITLSVHIYFYLSHHKYMTNTRLYLPKTLASTTSVNKDLSSERSKCSSSFSSFSLYANSSILNIMSFTSEEIPSNLQLTLGAFWETDSLKSVVSSSSHWDLGKVRFIAYLWPTCKNPRCAVNCQLSRFCITISLSLPKVSASSPKWTRCCSVKLDTHDIDNFVPRIYI